MKIKSLYLYIVFVLAGISPAHGARLELLQDSLWTVEKPKAYVADSLNRPGPFDKNPAADASLVASILTPLPFLAGVAGLDYLFFGAVVGGILGLVSFILGIAGLRKRKKIIQEKYSSRPDSDILPLGFTKSYVGVVGGLVTFATAVILFVSVLLAF